jgi:methylenetetrahydrofolate dehydrogenase (NADP+) / methenyltetrahydrofolate cyclohydrolase
MRYNTIVEISGHTIAEKIYKDLSQRVATLRQKKNIPHLVVFLIGENPASISYVTLKQKRGEELGCKVTILRYPETITTQQLEKKITLLNEDPSVHAILIQRPIPEHIDIKKLELLTNPQKDIDGFHLDSSYTLPLPLAVVKILEEIHLIGHSEKTTTSIVSPKKDAIASLQNDTFINWLKTKNIVILGKGPTGGGPIISYLNKLTVHPTLIDSKTKNPKKLIKAANIIISAVGKEHVITANQITKGVILIGVGVCRGKDGKLHGDYEEEQIKDIVSYYTPTPRGVGPVNVAMLIDNLITATEKQT